MANAERTKNFMFIVYPDNKNMVENWREVIQDYGHKAFISPIHDKDTYEKDVKNDNGEIIHHKGDLKKAHYHVCVCRSTPTTVRAIVKQFESVYFFYLCCVVLCFVRFAFVSKISVYRWN